MYYTYVLLSTVDAKHYIGITGNLHKRLMQHARGEVAATRGRRPFRLVYYEACRDFAKAHARERYFKTGFGRRFLASRI